MMSSRRMPFTRKSVAGQPDAQENWSMRLFVCLSFALAGMVFTAPAHAETETAGKQNLAARTATGRTDASGTSVSPVGIDFSFAGYGAGRRIPAVAAVLSVRPTGGDDTALLQGAIDRIASMPMRPDGFHGALLLAPGRFRIGGHLSLRESGIVLRGASRDKTVLVAEGLGRRSLLVVGASENPDLAESHTVMTDAAAGSRTLVLDSTDGLAVGDRVVVRRPSTREWIGDIAMSGLPGTFANQRLDWQPGSHDLMWDRVITALDSARHSVELDAPITTALEQKYGGGTVAKVSGAAPPTHIGIEDLTLESTYDASRPKDEEHAWIAVQIDGVEDAWVRRVTARHFVSSAVRVNWRGRRITVEDCRSEAPMAEIAGYRRQGFVVNGQQVLVRRCWSEAGMNDFASGLLAAGPNVFLDCDAEKSLGPSGSFEGWSSGVLYERVRVPDARIALVLDQARAQGGGWTAANSVIWNSTAQSIDALGPPGAPNYVVNSTRPLYESQLLARTGTRLAADAPPAEEKGRTPVEFRVSDIRPQVVAPVEVHAVQIVNGRFVHDGKVMWGPSQNEAWWRGDTSPQTAAQSTGSAVSRFMPGVTAPGETEDLAEMADRLAKRNLVTMQVTPGLWYEHRRDSHNVERRDDGNVWAPFFEMPWARSGKGIAWDGLSRFDVSRYNPWYFERHKEFAKQAAAKGFVVIYELYNTHDVLEIQPHYIDYPWRPANNINDTGLQEPPPFEPHNTNNIGNQFFSADYPSLRELHRAYMLHTFDELAGEPNVIFSMAYQYAGPLKFEQFFQDVAAEWSAKHGKPIRVALITGKNTTDAILADPVRSKQIAIVDMRYWEYKPDGTLWAPDAGQNLAFRKIIQSEFPGYSDTPPATTPEMVYRETREYRDKYPNIALMPMEEGAGPIPLLMGGAASQSALVGGRPPVVPPSAGRPAGAGGVSARPSNTGARGLDPANPDRIIESFVQNYLASDLMKMSPQDGWTADLDHTWSLAGGASEPVLMYSLSGTTVAFAKSLPSSRYSALWFDPHTGNAQTSFVTTGAAGTSLTKPNAEPWLLLLTPQQ
jgi:hypothetical protein